PGSTEGPRRGCALSTVERDQKDFARHRGERCDEGLPAEPGARAAAQKRAAKYQSAHVPAVTVERPARRMQYETCNRLSDFSSVTHGCFRTGGRTPFNLAGGLNRPIPRHGGLG